MSGRTPPSGAPDTRLLEAVRTRLIREAAEPTLATVAAAVRAEGAMLGDAEVLTISRTLRADLAGVGPLEPLMAAPEITDILVNGPRDVWVDDGAGLRRVEEVRFADEEAVRRLAQRLAAQAGRRLDTAAPWADARLPSGARLHAVLPPVSPEGTRLSLRLPRHRVFSLAELAASGALPPPGVFLLRSLVESRFPFLVSGGTGTGKTTLLSTLLSLAGPQERLLLVEESAELRPEHPHVIRLQARPANIEGRGGVELDQLVRQALRMRPDRLVVGEVRGPEVVSLLHALNTGHEGGCGTLHANTATDVPARIEALGCAAGLSREAVHSQLAATRALVVHLVREPGGPRRVAQLCVLRRGSGGLVTAVPAVTFPDGGGLLRDAAFEELRDRFALRSGRLS
ncbi:TadA family conjugal transfer-associated ATPase [Thermobifida halotolerans]|uniref:TadA family conjugal transfer-associated ATPase n=1 Tax=Thermobifida halotolerans TaxID=483545 RepID=A0AA97M3I8_9ACTN|nr:TadA family conjugal transfer-associated ATPase [Thermobifida halotolerans]UOE19193.1 TadA family conjugal transfer-associated ATPase [Thermobifida halotolerans]